MCQKPEKTNEEKIYILHCVLCKWFTAQHSKGNPLTGPVIYGKGMSSYDGMKTEKCTLSEGWLHKLGSV
jgi:hypothetical protein